MSRSDVSSAWLGRLVAAGVHLLLSAAVAVVMALLVFKVWYPKPLHELAGGQELFLLVVACDVVLGPLITFVVFNRKKPRAELVRDLAVVLALQLGALAYGVWTVYVARPVALVFEKDLYRVVRKVDIPESMEAQVAPEFQPVPWRGPMMISLRDFKDDRERMATTARELEGLPMAAMPTFWQPYSLALAEVQRKGGSAQAFLARYPAQQATVNQVLADSSLALGDVVAFPLVHGTQYWTVLVSRHTAEPVGFVPVDPYEK